MNNLDPYKQAVGNIDALRAMAGRMAQGAGPDFNPIRILNDYLHAETKRKVIHAHYDKIGETIPMAALALALDAGRNANHRRTLARNLSKASGTTRPVEVEAHHIVATHDFRAEMARLILFLKGIAINDAANGCFLPKNTAGRQGNLVNARLHRRIHTDFYYMAVNARLVDAKQAQQSTVRSILRTIAAELIAGTFPY